MAHSYRSDVREGNFTESDTENTGGGNLPTGGVLNQLLVKSSSANYDAAWCTEDVEIVAQDILSAFDPVTITGKLANSSNLAHYGKVVGLSDDDVAIGFTGSVTDSGLIVNPLWDWSVGSSIFLNGTTLSLTAPTTGFSLVIGVAKTATTIFVSLSDPILL